MIAQLEEAKARADEFRGRSARWQVTLTDGIADLIADMEHDLRDRLRKVQREAETSIDEGDPGPIWDQITEWLDQRVAAAVSETFVWTDERSRWLSEEVAQLFSEGESGAPGHRRRRHRRACSTRSSTWRGLDAGRLGAGEKIYIGVRGSYGGVLMVGLATGLIGLSLINPLSLLAGVLVGRRAYREDMSTRLSRRQHEAKLLVRRYIDEVIFQVGKQLKDRLRLVQRSARDHFGSMAEELHRSLTEALSASKQAAGTYTSQARRARRRSCRRSSSSSRRCTRRCPRCRRCARRPLRAVNGPSEGGRRGPAAHRGRRLRGRPCGPGRDRRTRAATARAAAARDRRHGQGRQVDAAERDARRADRTDRCRRSARGWSRGTATPTTPTITLHPHDGEPRRMPVRREQGRLVIDLGGMPAEDVDWIDVGWPLDGLKSMILIDTPGHRLAVGGHVQAHDALPHAGGVAVRRRMPSST